MIGGAAGYVEAPVYATEAAWNGIVCIFHKQVRKNAHARLVRHMNVTSATKNVALWRVSISISQVQDIKTRYIAAPRILATWNSEHSVDFVSMSKLVTVVFVKFAKWKTLWRA